MKNKIAIVIDNASMRCLANALHKKKKSIGRKKKFIRAKKKLSDDFRDFFDEEDYWKLADEDMFM